MKWLLLVGVALVVVVAIVAIVGSMLPRNHVASRTLHVRRAPQDVWAVVTELAGGSSIPVEVVESTPPTRLVTRVKETERNFGGTWTIAISPSPDGSTLTISEDGWVANPIFRFISRFVIGHHATMDALLKNVAKQLDQEPVVSGE